MVTRSYRIEIAPAAKRQLKKLPRSAQNLVIDKIATLAANPRAVGTVKLTGIEDLYRIRVGDYRIIYHIQDKMLLIVVVKVANRKDVYKSLS